MLCVSNVVRIVTIVGTSDGKGESRSVTGVRGRDMFALFLCPDRTKC